MKKRIFCLLVCLLLCLAVSLPAFAAGEELVDLTETPARSEAETPTAEPETLSYVTDVAGILTSGERSSLEAEAKRVSEQYGCGVYIIVVDDYRRIASTVADANVTLRSFYNLGYGEGRDSIQLLMSMAERDYDLWGKGEFAEYAFTDYAMDRMEESFLPYFRQNNWSGGFRAYIREAERMLLAAANGEPVAFHLATGIKALIALGPSSLLGFAVCGGFKSQMKTAKEKDTAEDYVVRGSARLRVRDDRFINQTRTVHVIESSSGGGGGGHRSGSGGGTSHHSGKF